MARTTPISPRPVTVTDSEPQKKERPLVYLICTVHSMRAPDRTTAQWWNHLSYLWEKYKISDEAAFDAIAAGPSRWNDIINEMHSPYNPEKKGAG